MFPGNLAGAFWYASEHWRVQKVGSHPQDSEEAMSIAQTQAKLKWEAACERLRFALERPVAAGDQRLDVMEAFRLVQVALQELQRAYAPGNDSSA